MRHTHTLAAFSAVLCILLTTGCSRSSDDPDPEQTRGPVERLKAWAKREPAEEEKEEEAQPEEEAPALDMQGRPVEALMQAFGQPAGKLKQGQRRVLLYPDFTAISEDGTTVTTIVLAEDYEPLGGTNAQRRAAAAAAPKAPPVTTISNGGREVNLRSVLVPGKVTVIDFYADWCGACRQLSPILEDMAERDPDIVLRKIDVVKWNTPVCQQFSIVSIPNVRVFGRKGQQVGGSSYDPKEIREAIAKAK